MLREKLIGHRLGENNKFRWRSHEIYRIEGLSYAVFDFAVDAVLLKVNGTIMGRRRRRLEKQIASGFEVEPNQVSS